MQADEDERQAHGRAPVGPLGRQRGEVGEQQAEQPLLAAGRLDVVQLVYNLFEQQPAAEALPLAQAAGTAIMARLALDEGGLTVAGKHQDVLVRDHVNPEGPN